MIRAQLIRSGDHIVGFKIKGHAEYAEHGQDIVCAAASFLAITVENSLELQLHREGTTTMKSGELFYRLPDGLTEDELRQAQIILQVLDTGFRNLEKEYPNYVQYRS